jgi:hypothetical protein
MSRLDDAMNRLSADMAESGAPLEVERAVLAEFDRVQRRKRPRYWFAAAGAIAASVAGLWMVGVWRMEHKPAQRPDAATPAAEAQPVAGAQVDAEAEQPFVPIPYVLPPGPYERVEVVRMSLPVSELIAAGFQMQTSDLGAQAEADVMVGQDGRARALRLISVSSFN